MSKNDHQLVVLRVPSDGNKSIYRRIELVMIHTSRTPNILQVAL